MSDTLRKFEPQDYLAILKRRKWQIAIPAAFLFSISIAIAYAWPPTYRSYATILFEEARITGDIVDPITSNRTDQRIQIISQQVLSHQNLIKLIDKFALYDDITTPNQRVKATQYFRDNVNFEFITADVNDPRLTRLGQRNIAFTLSFIHEDPQTAQRVVNELVSLYLAENERERKEKARQTTEFLAREADKLEQLITELESRLADLKLKNAGRLPNEDSVNQQITYQQQLEMLQLRHQTESLLERKIYLQSELSQVNPYASITLDDGAVLRPDERLKKLQSQYSELSYTYGPKHPTMVEIATEIENLKSAIGTDAMGGSEKPTNPAYIHLQTELEAVNSTLKSLEATRNELATKLQALENQFVNAPNIEREYRLLTRKYENAMVEYRSNQEKLAEAQRLEMLESERKSEHLSVIEPAMLPSEPERGNRALILTIGFVLSLGGGAGVAAAVEILDRAVRGPKRLAAITGAMPLVVVPYIQTAADKRRNRIRWFVAFPSVILIIIAGIVILPTEHIMRLDVLITRIVSQLHLM